MRKLFLCLLLTAFVFVSKAQVFDGNKGASVGAIPDTGALPTSFPLTVSGVGVINGAYGLSSVQISIRHPHASDLVIKLKSPDGTLILLSSKNGWSGANYTNTLFKSSATSSIAGGTAPFTGNYLPQDSLGLANNGQNSNGIWEIQIQDKVKGNVGSLLNWTLTFNNTPATPVFPPPSCVSSVVATGNCNDAPLVSFIGGYCGNTSSAYAPTHTWPALTYAFCGSIDNNSFIKFRAADVTASFLVWVTNSQQDLGIQMFFWGGNGCNSPVIKNYGCNNQLLPSSNLQVVTATGLIPDQTYYLMFDGFAGDVCDYTVVSLGGVYLSPISTQPTSYGTAVNTQGKRVANVRAVISSPLGGGTTIADSLGKYAFSANGGSYAVHLTKNNDKVKANGVSVIDLLQIQSHLLNKVKLNSPYKLIAADVNNSGTITTLDILTMKRLIMGLDTTFPGNRLWAFVDSAYRFPDSTKPFPYKDSIMVNNLTSNQVINSFIGLKLGDVNYDWDASKQRTTRQVVKPLELFYQPVTSREAATIRIPIRVNNFKELMGLQYTLNFNPSQLSFLSVENNRLGIEYATNHSAEGTLSFLWSDDQLQAKTLADSSLLLELVFAKTGGNQQMIDAISLSSDITPIEAWDANNVQHTIIMNASKAAMETMVNTEAWSIAPNPAHDVVKLSFDLQQSKAITLQLTNSAGKVVMQQKLVIAKGSSTTSIDLQAKTKLPVGIYTLKAIGIDGRNVQQVVIR